MLQESVGQQYCTADHWVTLTWSTILTLCAATFTIHRTAAAIFEALDTP